MQIIILYVICAFIIQALSYKYIRYIDKKERKKLQIWETEYINNNRDLLLNLKKKKEDKKDDNIIHN